MTHIINTNAIILFISGKTIRVEKTDRKYAKIINVFNLPKEEQEAEVERIVNFKENVFKTIATYSGFEIRKLSDSSDQCECGCDCEESDDCLDCYDADLDCPCDSDCKQSSEVIFYNDEKLPKALSDKVLSIIRDGLPLEHFAKFWENLNQNPSAQSVKELTEFLEYKELPITDDGCFLAYKGVNNDYYSSHGNLDTKVIQGKANDRGQLFNGVGQVLEVRRRDVDDDRNKHCSHGLHCGSLDYARGFAPKLIVVKVNPKDVVSVPSDYSCQKCRVAKYEVISEFVEEITASVVDSKGQDTIVTNDGKVRSDFVTKVETYINNKIDDGYSQVTLRQIQNSFSPGWATKTQVLDALQELELYWTEDKTSGVTYVQF
jgi:hypothetical protein